MNHWSLSPEFWKSVESVLFLILAAKCLKYSMRKCGMYPGSWSCSPCTLLRTGSQRISIQYRTDRCSPLGLTARRTAHCRCCAWTSLPRALLRLRAADSVSLKWQEPSRSSQPECPRRSPSCCSHRSNSGRVSLVGWCGESFSLLSQWWWRGVPWGKQLRY